MKLIKFTKWFKSISINKGDLITSVETSCDFNKETRIGSSAYLYSVDVEVPNVSELNIEQISIFLLYISNCLMGELTTYKTMNIDLNSKVMQDISNFDKDRILTSEDRFTFVKKYIKDNKSDVEMLLKTDHQPVYEALVESQRKEEEARLEAIEIKRLKIEAEKKAKDDASLKIDNYLWITRNLRLEATEDQIPTAEDYRVARRSNPMEGKSKPTIIHRRHKLPKGKSYDLWK